MANSIQVQTSMNSTVDNMTLSIRSSVTSNTTSSNALGQSVNISASGWAQLSTGSLTDIRTMAFYNDNAVNTASVITIATGSAGQNPLATLQPGDGAIIPWSGSINGLYAKVVSANPAVNGVIQYQAQQS
jgi:hypothetical protein